MRIQRQRIRETGFEVITLIFNYITRIVVK